jgi:Flp pilus assembly pilin Flp
MDSIAKLYVRITEGNFARARVKLTHNRGQTMTEYAMILAAIAVVVLVSYQTLATKTISALTTVDNQL